MIALPEALEGLAAYTQFMVSDVNSIPIDPTTGYPADAQDSSNWLSAEQALEAAGVCNGNVSFVFTALDPFFVIDIDKAYKGGKWSQIANDLCIQFAGCAVEVSRSGDGLHIIGTTGAALEHKKKHTKLRIELYTSKRAIRLTGTHAVGSVMHDPGAALLTLVEAYFKPDPKVSPSEWTDGPTPEWSGPSDDAELLAKAMRARSSAGMFGGVTFADLWNAEEDALSVKYPPAKSGVYDHTNADAALCSHLAFWTGKDCARIDRMFRTSALYREKWERNDYRTGTILFAVSRCNNVYVGKKPTPPPGPATTDGALGPVTATAAAAAGAKMMYVSEQGEYFKECVYVIALHRVMTPKGMLRPEQFKAVYGGYIFMMDALNDKTTKNAWEVFTESRALEFPKVYSTCFRPECPPGAIIVEEGYLLVNAYVPIETARRKGDASPFINHLANILPDQRDQDILMSYMAACVQYPGIKFQWAPLLQGCEGNGKTIFINCLAHAIGHRYTHLPNAADLGGNGGKFNSWLQNKLFIGIEEIHMSDRREVSDALKPLITNRRVEIQGKGQDQVTGDNRANFFLCTNPKDAVLKNETDRRYCIFYTAQQNKIDLIRKGWISPAGHPTAYFKDLYEWLRVEGYEIVNDYLRSYAIPDELNPATMCHRAPVTSSTTEALTRSIGPMEQEILEVMEEGKPGFAGGWVSSMALDRLLEKLNATRIMPRARRREMLKSFGYELHPGLKDGRVNCTTQTDAGRPRLHIKPEHPAYTLTNSAIIVSQYDSAQSAFA